MRRRRLACLALAATAVTVVTACDTDDGREMQTPDSYARFQLQNTTTSTSTTVAPPPTEFIPVTTSTVPATSSTSSTSSSSTTTPAGAGSTTTGPAAQPAESASPAAAAAAAAAQLQFTGPWVDGAAIPVDYTCDGAGAAPLITWTAPPQGTAELALSVIDPDADGFVHWLVIGLPTQAGSVGGGEPLVTGAAEGINGFGNVGWGGPCPPPGGGPHTYRFTLHMLDQAIELPADSPTTDLLAAVDAATASGVTLTGTFERG